VEKDQIVLADYFARSSIASIASNPYCLNDDYYTRIASEFQRRMVKRDLTKTFLDEIADRKDFDFILLDLIDERFDLYEASPGSMLTLSTEFMGSGFLSAADRSGSLRIRSGSERHRELWKSGVKRLFTILAGHNIASRVVVNKVFWANQTEDGTPLPAKDLRQRDAANSLLAWMYEELEKYVPESRWITFPETVLRGNPNHRWGIAPFHYSNAYYHDAVSQLKRMSLDMSKDGAALLEAGRLFAWSGSERGTTQRTCFLIFKNKVLVHEQPYSVATEIQFDVANLAGEYEMVIFTLAFDPAEPNKQPVRRRESMFRFFVN
jgi:hypothetical protein